MLQGARKSLCNETIAVKLKDIGKIGYIANTPYTKATGTKSAGAIAGKVKKKFKVKVMFITSSEVICKVVDGVKCKKGKDNNCYFGGGIKAVTEDVE